MFGGKQPSNTSGRSAGRSTSSGSTPSGGAAGLNSLVKGTHVEGRITAPSDIRIEGTLKGDLECEAKLIIGPSGVVEGNVRCRTAMVEGKFDGTLVVADLLEVRDSARVEGEITYGKLKIDSGAVLLGTVKMSSGNAGGGGDKSGADTPSANGAPKRERAVA